jgi:hypothetical protein
MNILHGPSNSGKSYVIGCINFMLGASEPPFIRADTAGYDTIGMTMESLEGHTIQMTRKIVDGVKTDSGANSVEVVSTFPGVESGDYSISKSEYSDMLLKLMGIQERHKIISTQEPKPQNLGNRTFVHSYFIDEDNIYEKIPAFDVPRHSKITACLSALHFLFCGNDLNQYLPEVSKKEKELREAKRDAVIIYINEKIQYLAEHRLELEEELASVDDTDIDLKIEGTVQEIANIEKEIQDASDKSRKLMEKIYSVSSKLEEATFLRDRYKSLKTQYSSDIKRLKFIIDGEDKRGSRKKVVKCPFCESEMDEKSPKRISYSAASEKELDRITLQLQDLKAAEKDLKEEITTLEDLLRTLNEQNKDILQSISRGLKPKAEQLREMLESYKRIVRIKNELSAVEALSVDLNTDAFNREQIEESDTPKFNIMDHIDMERWKQWSDTFEAIVKECKYPSCNSARISPDTYDAVVNGKHKASEGKGYRAFLNSIILFSLMKVLEDGCAYRPAMLILDSPILTLKEKKKIRPEELAEPGMRESLFRYFVNNCGDNQVIIAENEIPASVDYSSANLIEFTLDQTRGRYGFLQTVPAGSLS